MFDRSLSYILQVSFVILSSRRRAIRAILNGDVVQSCVRRHPIQSSFLKDAGRQIRIIKLQGFLFFGTISNVEIAVRKILDAANWSTDPIRYLVVDFSSASGVDFSAAEAFVRMQRLLDERGVILVLCGCPVDSEVGIALRSVGLWTDTSDGKVVVLENLNDALEVGHFPDLRHRGVGTDYLAQQHCENAFLRSLYSRTFRPPLAPGSSGSAIPIASQIGRPSSDSPQLLLHLDTDALEIWQTCQRQIWTASLRTLPPRLGRTISDWLPRKPLPSVCDFSFAYSTQCG